MASSDGNAKLSTKFPREVIHPKLKSKKVKWCKDKSLVGESNKLLEMISN